MKVTKTSVGYHAAPKNAPERCGTCEMFNPPSACNLVEGLINANDVCMRWRRKGTWKPGPRKP